MMAVVVLTTGCGPEMDVPSIGDRDERVSTTGRGLSRSTAIDYIAVQFCTGGDNKRDDSYFNYSIFTEGHRHDYRKQSAFRGIELRDWTCTPYEYFGAANRPYSHLTGFRLDYDGDNGSLFEHFDNWNLQSMALWVRESADGQWHRVWAPSGSPRFRFTSRSDQLIMPWGSP